MSLDDLAHYVGRTPAETADVERVRALLADPDPWRRELPLHVTASALIVQFEMHLLNELGFGLELDACAVTGTHEELIYVSPKSGRAVSRQAGAPWRDKLLRLPAFLMGTAETDPSGSGKGS